MGTKSQANKHRRGGSSPSTASSTAVHQCLDRLSAVLPNASSGDRAAQLQATKALLALAVCLQANHGVLKTDAEIRQRTEAQICSSHGASSMAALLRSSKVDVATQAAEAAASLAACSPILVPALCFPPLVALLQAGVAPRQRDSAARALATAASQTSSAALIAAAMSETSSWEAVLCALEEWQGGGTTAPEPLLLLVAVLVRKQPPCRQEFVALVQRWAPALVEVVARQHAGLEHGGGDASDWAAAAAVLEALSGLAGCCPWLPELVVRGKDDDKWLGALSCAARANKWASLSASAAAGSDAAAIKRPSAPEASHLTMVLRATAAIPPPPVEGDSGGKARDAQAVAKAVRKSVHLYLEGTIDSLPGHERDLLVSSLEALIALLRPSRQPLGTSTLGSGSSSPGSWASLLLEPKGSVEALLLRLAKGHLGGGSEKSCLLSWEALRAASVASAAHPVIVGCEGAVQLVMRHALMPRLAITECTAMGRTGMSPAAISAALFLLADVTDCLWRKGRPNRGRSKPGGAGRAEGSAWADILSAWQAETKAVFCCCGSSENAPDEASELERKRGVLQRIVQVAERALSATITTYASVADLLAVSLTTLLEGNGTSLPLQAAGHLPRFAELSSRSVKAFLTTNSTRKEAAHAMAALRILVDIANDDMDGSILKDIRNSDLREQLVRLRDPGGFGSRAKGPAHDAQPLGPLPLSGDLPTWAACALTAVFGVVGSSSPVCASTTNLLLPLGEDWADATLVVGSSQEPREINVHMAVISCCIPVLGEKLRIAALESSSHSRRVQVRMGGQVGSAELQAVLSWAYSGVCDLPSSGADPAAFVRLADGLGLRTLAAQAGGCRPRLGEVIQQPMSLAALLPLGPCRGICSLVCSRGQEKTCPRCSEEAAHRLEAAAAHDRMSEIDNDNLPSEGPAPFWKAARVCRGNLPHGADLLLAAPLIEGKEGSCGDIELLNTAAKMDSAKKRMVLFPAHRCIVASASEYCSAMLSSRWHDAGSSLLSGSEDGANLARHNGTIVNGDMDTALPAAEEDDIVELPVIRLPDGQAHAVGGLLSFIYGGQLCFRHWSALEVAEDPLPGSSLPPLARTLNARNMCLCSEVLAALQTAKLAETCLMAGASAAVAAFLDDRMPAMKPDCRLKALEHALRLGLWDLGSDIAETVAPHYMELRAQGSFDHCTPVVEEALRDAYAEILVRRNASIDDTE